MRNETHQYSITCNRCSHTAPMEYQNAHVVGWSTMNVSVNPDYSQPLPDIIKVLGSNIDLCPECTDELHQWLENE